MWEKNLNKKVYVYMYDRTPFCATEIITVLEINFNKTFKQMKAAGFRGSTTVRDILLKQESLSFLLNITRKPETTGHMKKVCSMDEIDTEINRNIQGRNMHLRPRITNSLSN